MIRSLGSPLSNPQRDTFNSLASTAHYIKVSPDSISSTISSMFPPAAHQSPQTVNYNPAHLPPARLNPLYSPNILPATYLARQLDVRKEMMDMPRYNGFASGYTSPINHLEIACQLKYRLPRSNDQS